VKGRLAVAFFASRVQAPMVTTGGGMGDHDAFTVFRAASSVSVQVGPLHAPLNPPKVWVESGSALRVTEGTENVDVQVAPHSRPAGSDRMTPPAPFCTVTCAWPVPLNVAIASPPGVAETVMVCDCVGPAVPGP
jgi:hypothetical protein